MPRWLIVCIDGTWNSKVEKSEYLYPTNVQRISELLIDDGKRQLVKYIPGIGTRAFVDRMIGGVWGSGARTRICEGYRFICENYQADDRIAFFGFSRGAFAVRSIIGVMANFGVLNTRLRRFRATNRHAMPDTSHPLGKNSGNSIPPPSGCRCNLLASLTP